MKVIQIIDTLGPGGAERVMVNLANLLHKKKEANLQVSILCLDKYGDLLQFVDPQIKIRCLNRSGNYNPLDYIKLATILKQYDIVHVHMRHVLKYVYFCKSLFGLKQKIVFHDHYGGIGIDRGYSTYLKKAIKSSSYIGVSKELTEWARKDLNVDQTYLLRNIIIADNCNKHIENKRGKTCKLLLVSHFRSQKNIAFAIDLINELNKENNANFQLDIIGRIVEKDYYKKILKHINSKGLEKKINVILNCFNVQQILFQYDMAIHVSKSETGPLVLIEYLAHGLPFLTYQTGEVVDQINNDVPEFILNNFQLSNWIGSVKNLLNQDQNNVKDRLNKIFNKYYSPEIYIKKCLKIYQQINQI